MNSPSQNYDAHRLYELVSAVMDETADEAQRRELTELLRSSADARDEYLALVDQHAVLSTELKAGPVIDEPVQVETAQVEPAQVSSLDSPSKATPIWNQRWIQVALGAALAACILVLVSLSGNGDPDVEPTAFATVAQVTNAVWDSGDFQLGSRFGDGTLSLKSGHVRIELDSGVEVTLEGPAEFELIDVATTELKSGLLTANVPSGAEGFSVNTPTAEIIDLGTSFGIDLRNPGFSNVSVFDGEVEVVPRDTREKRLLSEGQSVRIGSDLAIEDVGFDPQPFEKLWPIASGITGSTDTIRFVPPWPRQIRLIQSDEDIFVAAEGRSFVLMKDLQVNISEPGEYALVEELTPTKLSPGDRVRSFALHYAPATQRGPRIAKRVTGSITFDRPVLGLIVRHEELLASSRRFSRRGLGETNPRRELQLTGRPDGDFVSLSEDRRTVTLELISPGRSSDLIRVIVESEPRRRHDRRRRRQ